MQCRSQTFTTDEGSVPRAKGESFLGLRVGACPRKIFKSNSSEIVFSAFFQWIFHQNSNSYKRKTAGSFSL